MNEWMNILITPYAYSFWGKKKKHLNWPQIFFGQQAPSSRTSSTYSPSLSHKGVGTEWQSGSTETTEPFSIHLYRQQPRTEPFHTSPGARGLPSLSVHTENVPNKNILRILIYWNPIVLFLMASIHDIADNSMPHIPLLLIDFEYSRYFFFEVNTQPLNTFKHKAPLMYLRKLMHCQLYWPQRSSVTQNGESARCKMVPGRHTHSSLIKEQVVSS